MSRKPSRSSSPDLSGKTVPEKITRTSAELPEEPLLADLLGSLTSTVSGPAHAPREEGVLLPDDPSLAQLLTQKLGSQRLAAAMPSNLAKPGEFGDGEPPTGQAIVPADDVVTASTVQEEVVSDKVGEGMPPCATNHNQGSLDRVRVDSAGRAITTNQGVPVADNQNSLKAGLRGPTLLEDFILREKITHFDHERIPERIVHARGSARTAISRPSGAHRADPGRIFSRKPARQTPVFVRFSTVAGERGSADTVRDTRGFAVKFYTREGNWDLVGNNIPVFFIQDAMKFPDVVHAVKPEPHHQMPQASSAHDTFWDFISLMPESIHHTLWVMSDRGIPRSYRTMQGFGVNTYRLVNAAGQSVFVKFHWLPVAGTHSLCWDEAVKIAGADPDFHRRDLWEAIEAGIYPEYELALQTFSEEQAEHFPFDVLDPTKLVPEELAPLRKVGRLVLDRNPDNFFAETEQVAFCVAHVVPGIDFSNDPLLQGRIHSYLDTQLSRLGGPNFHELPINSPLAEVHNNQRDGMHRQAIARGRVSYEPNSLAGGCPFQAGPAGFMSVRETMNDSKVRGKPEKFADHFSQATLFYRSQSPVEQRHLIAAFRFELSRCTVAAVRERVVSLLRNVDEALAAAVAGGIGIELPASQPPLVRFAGESEVSTSAALSLFARPGDGALRGRRVALLAVAGVDGGMLRATQSALVKVGVAPRVLSLRLGQLAAANGELIEVETTLEAMPSVLWDAAVIFGHPLAAGQAIGSGQVLEFIRDQFRHCKPLLVIGQVDTLRQALGLTLSSQTGKTPAGVIVNDDPAALAEAIEAFIAALARHRHFEREEDPPAV
jgi:catalase